MNVRGTAGRAGAGLLSLAAGVSGPAWLNYRRGEYWPGGRELDDTERGALEGFFEEDLLGVVRVAQVGCIVAPWVFRAARRLGLGNPGWLEMPTGLALNDLIVVRQVGDRLPELSLLFHEMVHVVQYRLMGVRGFMREYTRGWAAAGFEYREIPLEIDAYELQARFAERPGERFDVKVEVRGRVGKRA